MSRLAATLLATGLCSAAAAQDMPRFDVDAACREVASFGGTYSASTDRSCFAGEQEAYDALKPKWAAVPPGVRAECTKIAAFGSPSYAMLKSCIESELDARAANRGRAFNY